jgi:hypothetical protein
MKVGIVTPAPARSRSGNRVTAQRWAGILRELGHRVSVAQEYGGERYDALIALHARRSSKAVARFRREHPGSPLILALTGTDLYRDIRTSRRAQESLESADRLVLLQPKGIAELAPGLRGKARVIFQSVAWGPLDRPSRSRHAEVCVVGHLRPVKDPFRAALAARLLPRSSRIRILHVGRAMDEKMAKLARAEMQENRRYQWLGELPRWRVRRIYARSCA